MLSKIYKKMDQADANRRKANKLNNAAELLDEGACDLFNKKIRAEHIQKLYEKVKDNGFEGEKSELQTLLNKKQTEDLNLDDLKKYRHLEEKYGENLDYNKSFIDRFVEYMGD